MVFCVLADSFMYLFQFYTLSGLLFSRNEWRTIIRYSSFRIFTSQHEGSCKTPTEFSLLLGCPAICVVSFPVKTWNTSRFQRGYRCLDPVIRLDCICHFYYILKLIKTYYMEYITGITLGQCSCIVSQRTFYWKRSLASLNIY